MTNRILYARSSGLLQLAVGLVGLLALSDPAVAQPAPCASCLVPVITPGAASVFPDHLGGFDVLVRVAAGREADAADALGRIALRGGRPGLLIQGLPEAPPESALLSRAHTIAIELDDERSPGVIFALKKLLTGMRAAAQATSAFGVSAATKEAARDLAGYVDFVIVRGEPLPPGDAPAWRAIAPATLDAALEATRARDATRWMWRLPDDPSVAASLLRDLTRPSDHPAEEVQVVAPRRQTVDEIVARHQAAAARQAAAITQMISTGTLTITFEAPGFAAPVTVTSDMLIYAGRDHTDLEQRRIRVNGVEFPSGRAPRLPIIEPERAASPPLAITLTNVYRYTLAEEDDVGGRHCYVVAFRPAVADDSTRQSRNEGRGLFRGRVWIAKDSFAMVKVAAMQTGLRGAIVSSEQIDELRETPAGPWLLGRSEIRQLYEGAGHRTPITRVLVMTTHEVNPPDFDARRAAAYASKHVMLRDTAEGYRYLKRSEAGAAGTPAAEPVVAGRAERIRTLAAGVIIDPNITRPLPFAGLSYVDFNLFGTGAQLNAFFGGTYGQLAMSVPSLGGSRWQLAGRAFGIASSYNDRAFVEGRERYEHNILQRPAHASVWLLRPLTTRMFIRVGYDLDYTRFARGSGTAADFVEPENQVVHGARVALDAQRGGWSGTVWWNPARRQGWRPWGVAAGGEYDRTHRDFQRYGASVTRTLVITPAIIAKIEAAWMAGRDLDRFSRYSFGSFENRLRGYPSALIRYDRGQVLRGAVTWAPGKLVRFDGFLDTAVVRDGAYGGRLRNYTGAGGAVETPAPFGTLLAIEWGYGFRGVNSDGRLGTQVVRVSAFKIF